MNYHDVNLLCQLQRIILQAPGPNNDPRETYIRYTTPSQEQTLKNASSVPTTLGGVNHGYLGMVLKDGWDEQCDLSRNGVAKDGKIFGVDGLDDLLDEGSLEK